MKLTQRIWVRPVVWLLLLAVTGVLVVRVQNAERDEWERISPMRRKMRLAQDEWESGAADRWRATMQAASAFTVMSNDVTSPKIYYAPPDSSNGFSKDKAR